MKNTISLIYLLFLVIILVACSVEEEQLTKVDVQKTDKEGNYEDKIVIVDKEKIDLIKKFLENTKWKPNTKAEMARKEDILATLYYTNNTNGTTSFKKKYQYRIWFNANETAIIISSNQTEGYGTLDKENSQNLKKILLN